MLLSRAAREGSPHPRITQAYLEGLPSLIKERFQQHDDDAAMRYRAGIPVLLEDPEIAALTSAAASLRDL